MLVVVTTILVSGSADMSQVTGNRGRDSLVPNLNVPTDTMEAMLLDQDLSDLSARHIGRGCLWVHRLLAFPCIQLWQASLSVLANVLPSPHCGGLSQGARCTAHGAQRTAHSAQRTAHSARRTAHSAR